MWVKSHMSKLFMEIVHLRINPKFEEKLASASSVLERDWVREKHLSIRVLLERCRDGNVDAYIGFIDYRKVFDTVQQEKLISVLNYICLDKDILE